MYKPHNMALLLGIWMPLMIMIIITCLQSKNAAERKISIAGERRRYDLSKGALS